MARIEIDYMNPEWGLKWYWNDKEIKITNNSIYIIYITINDPYSITSIDSKKYTIIDIIDNTVRVSLSYYTKEHNLKSLCTNLLCNKGRHIKINNLY